MRRLGVRPRVVGAFALIMALVLGGIGLAIQSGVADQLTDITDDSLETRAAAIGKLLVERGGVTPGLTTGLDDPGETFSQIVAPGERLLASTDGLPRAPLLDAAGRRAAAEGVTLRLRGVTVEPDEGDDEIDLEALEDTAPEAFEDDRARVIARSVTVGGERLAIVVGATLEDREDALRALRQVLLVALPLALLAACAAGWFAVGAALRPVERMRARAEGISETSLDDRLPVPPADDELRRLGTTLNLMLDRLEGALERERAFVADASHELRTPLAVLRTELELALREGRSAEELLAAVRSAHEEATHLSSLAEGLLLLARADHGGLVGDPVELDAGALTERVAQRFARQGRDVSAPAPEPAGLVVRGDALRLEHALGNLTENALRHGAEPVELLAAAAAADGFVELVVADRGPGVPEAFAARAFERFTRQDAARSTEGAGLGLAIVQAVARAHGGEALLRPRAGGGAEAVIRLPARPRPPAVAAAAPSSSSHAAGRRPHVCNHEFHHQGDPPPCAC